MHATEVRTAAKETTLRDALLMAGGFALALAAAAQVRILLPNNPVPITLQTFVLYSGAAVLATRTALAGVGLYVGLALIGLPVLSGLRGGLAAFGGATGGYVLGWFVAVLVLSRLLDRQLSWARTAATMTLGTVIILFCGTLHLGLLLGLSPAQAFLMGAAPFIPGDVLKIVAASTLVRRWPSASSR